MFITAVNPPNAACINDALMAARMAGMAQSTPHPSIKRLFGVAKERGDTTPTQVAKTMNVSSQTFTNWTSRGLSLEGALRAQLTYGCDANWLLGIAPQPRQFGSGEATLDMQLMRSAILVTERAIHARRVVVTPEARAAFTLGAYDILKEDRNMEKAERIVARMLLAVGGATITN